ncbi:hypothetical protein DFH11DRAFT_1513636 [Phellopilus nigrolimitatus]|nr:hypothetical protein DFH11DRAFT_1513636 [Phellopilus nigrolimitatus]
MSNATSSANASSLLNQSQTQPSASRRFTHFQTALHLAIQRASHKWTYEEFSECFELWCKEEPDGASGVYNTISLHMEHLITNACDELFVRYKAHENIDIMHKVVTEARERQKAGLPPGPDTWKANLEPRAAARARTVPILRQEKDVLEAQLVKLEKENLNLQNQIMENVHTMKEADAEEVRRLDLLDELEAKWSSLPIEDIQEWTLRTAETLAMKPVV